MVRGTQDTLLIAAITVIAACGIFYELLISTLSVYLLGGSILHFSLTIGIFMFFMGIGSWLSRYVRGDLIRRFVEIEILIGIFGGGSIAVLQCVYTYTEYYYIAFFFITSIIAGLIGAEIPLLTRVLCKNREIKNAVADVLAFDSVGALIASLLFPLFLLPYFGVLQTCFLIGVINLIVAILTCWFLRHSSKGMYLLSVVSSFGIIILLGGINYSTTISSHFEREAYQDPIIFSSQSRYQKIVLTKYQDDIRLFLNGNIQFSSRDEHRYHESLVHLPVSLRGGVRRALLLGAGDGLAARELLKYSDLETLVLAELDPSVIELAINNRFLSELNRGSLEDPRVRIEIGDGFKFLENTNEYFDIIIADFPDPNEVATGMLYSREFYQLVKRRLSKDGVFITQASSPYFARKAFWAIDHTIASVFRYVTPFTVNVPSFGQWGFVMASNLKQDTRDLKLRVSTKYLTDDVVSSLFIFPPDMSDLKSGISTLTKPHVVSLYQDSSDYWE